MCRYAYITSLIEANSAAPDKICWLKIGLRHPKADAVVEIPTDLCLASLCGMTLSNQQPSKQPPNYFGLAISRGQIPLKLFILLVPGGGVEPPRGCPRRILSPLRLPVPPSRLDEPAAIHLRTSLQSSLKKQPLLSSSIA